MTTIRWARIVQGYGFLLCLLGATGFAIAAMASGPLVHGSAPRYTFVLLGVLMLCLGAGAMLRYRSVVIFMAAAFLLQLAAWTPGLVTVVTAPFDGLQLFNALFWSTAALIPVVATALGWRELR